MFHPHIGEKLCINQSSAAAITAAASAAESTQKQKRLQTVKVIAIELLTGGRGGVGSSWGSIRICSSIKPVRQAVQSRQYRLH
jgi:molecular chaperone DnaK (HSP70)